jgi:hypothetical protein
LELEQEIFVEVKQSMKLDVTSYSIPKNGSTEDESDDAFCSLESGQHGGNCFRFAVSDGVTEGMLSRDWARQLVNSFRQVSNFNLITSLKEIVQAWNSWLSEYLLSRETNNNPIKWYEEPGLKKGAFATFLGLELFDGVDDLPGTWKAIAVGDSCLFQIRYGDENNNICGGELITRFPIFDASEFSDIPYLVSSNPLSNQDIESHTRVSEGEWLPGDHFYLMTDALAAWFLCYYECRQFPWHQLNHNLDDHDSFADWVGRARNEGMTNDDTTIIRIRVQR